MSFYNDLKNGGAGWFLIIWLLTTIAYAAV
jgi:hypothetical protein